MYLALETAGPVSRFWLVDKRTAKADQGQPDLEWESGRQLAAELLGKITTFLRQHDHDLADLSGLLVFSGPGSFTSLRIGHTVANALADGLGIPVAGAMGERWLSDGLTALSTAKPGQPVMPEYGAGPNITAQKR